MSSGTGLVCDSAIRAAAGTNLRGSRLLDWIA